MRVALAIILALIVCIGIFRPSGDKTAQSVPAASIAAVVDSGAGEARAGLESLPLRPAKAQIVIPAVAGEADATDRCDTGSTGAALANAASLETLEFAPFRRPETGWAVYAPRIAAEIGTRCGPLTPGFAAALARWQVAHSLPPTGIVDIESFAAMNGLWTAARPFVAQVAGGNCPPPPPASTLATARAEESFGGKTIQLRAEALAAYRRMVATARQQVTGMQAGGRWLRIFSGYRDPDADALRCAIEGNCQGVVRAACSAHRTGLAMDMDVGAAPGSRPDSSDDSNRRAMVQSPVYRWLVQNAARFGFVNYVFEPWHWEWRGNVAAAPLDSAAAPRQ